MYCFSVFYMGNQNKCTNMFRKWINSNNKLCKIN